MKTIEEKYWCSMAMNESRPEVVNEVITFLSNHGIPLYASVTKHKASYLFPYIAVGEEGIIDTYDYIDDFDILVTAEEFINRLLPDMNVKIDIRTSIDVLIKN